MSHLASRPRAVGLATALLAGLTISVALSSCNRASPPVTSAANAAPATSQNSNNAAKTATPAAPTPGANAPAGAAANPAAGPAKGPVDEKDKARQAAAEMVPVETAPVTRGAISAFLSFNSTLDTEAAVDIYPQTSGQVELLFVEEGQVVKEGDPLLKIEDRELRVDVEDATTNYEHLQKSFARIEDLYARNLINKQDYEDQRFQIEQARLKVDRAKIRLSYATVTAPFAGVISSRDTQLGARVGTGNKVFSMVKLDDIVARVFVPGRYLSIVAENQPAMVTSEFLPDRTFKGWVKRISPVIDPKSGTFKVTVGVRGDKSTDLPPGLFVGVRVITDTRPSAVLIPKRAIVYEGGERYVFEVVKDRAVKRKLTAGYEDPQNIEALSGFAVGAKVIVLGHSGLKDGAQVRAVNETAPEQAKADEPVKAASATEPVKTGE